jgi:NADH:ubiquinone oxidoreductase subunit 2 (subunit N)
LLSAITNESYVTVLLIVIISSIASFYYIRLIKTFFFVKSNKKGIWISSFKRSGSEFNIGLLLFFNLMLSVRPDIIALFSTILTISVC